MPAIRQERYDDARKTWDAFVSLCGQDRYGEALDFYFADKEDGKGSNAGDFLVHLKHSTYRYTFLSDVLMPLMMEYRDEEFALGKFVDLLQLEKSLEDITIRPADVGQMSCEKDGSEKEKAYERYM